MRSVLPRASLKEPEQTPWLTQLQSQHNDKLFTGAVDIQCQGGILSLR
ncbi:MAG: hypothetical protein AAGA38_13225 [Pseudomonadota bacterium]